MRKQCSAAPHFLQRRAAHAALLRQAATHVFHDGESFHVTERPPVLATVSGHSCSSSNGAPKYDHPW